MPRLSGFIDSLTAFTAALNMRRERDELNRLAVQRLVEAQAPVRVERRLVVRVEAVCEGCGDCGSQAEWVHRRRQQHCHQHRRGARQQPPTPSEHPRHEGAQFLGPATARWRDETLVNDMRRRAR